MYISIKQHDMSEQKGIFDMDEKELRNALIREMLDHRNNLKEAVRTINGWQQAYREANDWNDKFLQAIKDSQLSSIEALDLVKKFKEIAENQLKPNMN